MLIYSMILSDLKDGPDPEGEKYLDKHDEWPWYTLKQGIEFNDELDDTLQDIGYVWIDGTMAEPHFIYDEICDKRTDLHKQIKGTEKVR